ncbi:hypothetical protein [Lysinibacillus sp. FSL L8-0126]|uniref:hypothetical protein n=1 Tax=Lysinibacillus sp. FSL L8-0126 TaxID=2921515 RepID=UPI00315AF12E
MYDLWIIHYEKIVEESTFIKTLGYLINHILPSLGNYRIEKISIAICQKHYDEWASKLKKLVQLNLMLKKFWTLQLNMVI